MDIRAVLAADASPTRSYLVVEQLRGVQVGQADLLCDLRERLAGGLLGGKQAADQLGLGCRGVANVEVANVKS